MILTFTEGHMVTREPELVQLFNSKAAWSIQNFLDGWLSKGVL